VYVRAGKNKKSYSIHATVRVKTYDALLLKGLYWLYMLKVLVRYCIVFIIEETLCGEYCIFL